ncbi:MAG: flagellar M-ring protein FliF [Pseudomonadales bacterium]|nr:flagellar M-ring protein FliF [Pseudomonadales bacterium]NRA18035.1 flagellar M-ring protein FliF [Oceanospirillaceae bacterium]
MADPIEAQATKGDLMVGFNKLSLMRQLGLMVGLAASIAIGFAIVLWSKVPDQRVLFSNLSFADASQVIEQLKVYNIPYTFEADGRAVLVPEANVNQARLRLAADGISFDKTIGFEILDNTDSLGSSQFMENARYRRGLEGELARTISSLLAVRHARVHLAIPKESVFVRDRKEPSASVFVELFSGRKLDNDQVSAIANLVASSISSLSEKNVTVVDQRGRMLNAREKNKDLLLAGKQFEYTLKVEQNYLESVNNILLPVVGQGRFRAQVSADMDFTSVEQTEELYNSDLPALRSEQTLDENRVGSAPPQGVPGALSNQPPGPSSVPEVANGAAEGASSSPGSSRKQATKNYELDRSLSYIKKQMGRVNRLTVAVVVDDVQVPGEDGAVISRPWSEADIERLSILVKSAVGYSAQRGDVVSVINSAFVAELAIIDEEIPFYMQPWVWDIAKQVGAALFLLLMVFGILRPILKNLVSSGTRPVSLGMGAAGDVAAELEGLSAEEISDDSVTFGGRDDGLLPTPNESFDYQVNSVRSMIAEDPARVAQAVKQWVKDVE